MIITFLGHSSFIKTDEYKKQLLKILSKRASCRDVEFFLGGYGGFDDFAYECCVEFKKAHPNAKLTFVTPYITESYQKNDLASLRTNTTRLFIPR